MLRQEKRTGLKRRDLHGGRSREFEGGRAVVVSMAKDGHGRVRLDLASSEESRPYVTLFGKYEHYGAGWEFVETAPRGYW